MAISTRRAAGLVRPDSGRRVGSGSGSGRLQGGVLAGLLVGWLLAGCSSTSASQVTSTAADEMTVGTAATVASAVAFPASSTVGTAATDASPVALSASPTVGRAATVASAVALPASSTVGTAATAISAAADVTPMTAKPGAPPSTVLAIGVAAGTPPTDVVVPHPLGQVISRVDTANKMVALTFDSNMTDDMLAKLDSHKVDTYANTEVVDLLESEQVPATFFLAAKWVQRYPELTKRLVSSPLWEVGSHSYQHKGFTPSCYTLAVLPVEQMADDVTRSFAELAPFGGNQVPYFRFPGLCVDDTAMAAIAPTKVTVIHGDVASGDAFGTNAKAITDQVLRLAKPGSIVVMHITKANAPKTHEALPGIISGLRAKGFALVKVSQLLGESPAG